MVCWQELKCRTEYNQTKYKHHTILVTELAEHAMTKTELRTGCVMNPARYWDQQGKDEQETEDKSPVVLQVKDFLAAASTMVELSCKKKFQSWPGGGGACL